MSILPPPDLWAKHNFHFSITLFLITQINFTWQNTAVKMGIPVSLLHTKYLFVHIEKNTLLQEKKYKTKKHEQYVTLRK